MRRPQAIVAAGVVTALLSNYWVLAGLLGERDDVSESWISDLAARSEAYGWRFEALEIASGLAVVGFAFLALRALGSVSRHVRLGLLALAAEGALTVIGGAAPLSCAESLDATCSLRYDALDVIHATAEVAATAALVLAFGLIALGLLRSGRRPAARATLAIGIAWLVLAALTGVGYLNADVDAIKGLCQRAQQVAFGVWLILLGLWSAQPRAPTPRSAPR